MAKKAKRVHVECTQPSGLRDFKRLVVGGVPPIGQIDNDGAIKVLRPDRFERVLEATRCVVVETLDGSRKRRR